MGINISVAELLRKKFSPDSVSEEQINLRITVTYRCLVLDFFIACLNRPETVPLCISLRSSLLYSHFSTEISGVGRGTLPYHVCILTSLWY